MMHSSAHAEIAARPRRTGMDKHSFAWLTAAGVGFWFLVGFPFGNHNESYYWMARFAHEHAWDIFWSKGLAATPRPLGQGFAYLGWRLSGGTIWAVQISNFLLAVWALRSIALAIAETRTFVVAMVVVGGSFFTGYIYLFHLHGIFYSPVLALIAALLYFQDAQKLTPLRADVAAFACALAVGLLFHPYALLIFLGYVGGLSVQRRNQWSSRDRLRPALLAGLAVIVLSLSRPPGHHLLISSNIRALVTSYALTEISPVLSVLSAVLAATTLLGIATMTPGVRLGLAAAALLCSAVFTWVGAPVIVLWILAALIKTAHLGQWAVAGMTASTAFLPVIAPSGSPTYSIFAVLMSTIALAWGWVAPERLLERLGLRWVVMALLLAALVAGTLRAGIHVPIASHVARPLLAEREKTRQLEAVIDWMLASEYRTWHLALEDNANPVDAVRDAADRRRRPPTYQGYLNAYLASRRGVPPHPQTLVVTFGTHPRPGLTLLKVVPGRFAGTVMVFK